MYRRANQLLAILLLIALLPMCRHGGSQERATDDTRSSASSTSVTESTEAVDHCLNFISDPEELDLQLAETMAMEPSLHDQGVLVATEEVEEKLRRVEASFPDAESFEVFLNGVEANRDRLRAALCRDLRLGKFLDQRFDLEVTDASARRYFDAHRGAYADSEQPPAFDEIAPYLKERLQRQARFDFLDRLFSDYQAPFSFDYPSTYESLREIMGFNVEGYYPDMLIYRIDGSPDGVRALWNTRLMGHRFELAIDHTEQWLRRPALVDDGLARLIFPDDRPLELSTDGALSSGRHSPRS